MTDENLQQALLDILPLFEGQVSVADIAFEMNMPISSIRYTLDALLEQGRIRKIAVKCYNKNYIRYRYEVVENTTT
jgi:predicted transcriptional regulator